jgi:hypothetical protein
MVRTFIADFKKRTKFGIAVKVPGEKDLAPDSLMSDIASNCLKIGEN